MVSRRRRSTSGRPPVRVRSGQLARGVVRHHAEVRVGAAEVVGPRRRDRRRPEAGWVRVGAVEDHAQVRLEGEGVRKTASKEQGNTSGLSISYNKKFRKL